MTLTPDIDDREIVTHWLSTCYHVMQIGAVGAQSLATVLETNKVLEHLALNNCNLGDDGVEPIANGVMNLYCLMHLSVT